MFKIGEIIKPKNGVTVWKVSYVGPECTRLTTLDERTNYYLCNSKYGFWEHVIKTENQHPLTKIFI